MTASTITAEGRRLRGLLLAAAGLVIVANLVAAVWERLARGEVVSGPNGSSYVTAGNGSAALAELLERLGVRVERLRRPILTGTLDPREALVVLDPGFSGYGRSEVAAVRRFLEGGGLLIYGGFPAPSLFASLGVDLEWSPAGATEMSPVAGTATAPGIDRVEGSGFGSFRQIGEATPLLAASDLIVAAAVPVGRGRLVALADASPLANDHIGRADNALLAVSLTEGRPVVFDEYRHGFGGQGLYGSLPARWRTTAAFLGLASILGLVAYGRRLGPPEQEKRSLPPERVRYVESVAGLVARTRDCAGAAARIRSVARRLLLARTGGDPEQAHAAGIGMGLTPGEVDAVLASTATEQELIETDHALAKLLARGIREERA